MPWKSPKPCSVPGCGRLARSRWCEAHTLSEPQRYEKARGSAADRGYGAGWARTRAAFLKAHPICCVSACVQPADVADHIVLKADGGSDDWSNLQPMCFSHHSAKTARCDGGYGNPRR